MSYITREEYDAAIGGYGFLRNAAEKFAEDYEEKFVGGKYARLTDLDVSGDEITGDIEMTFDVSYCGCCPGEYERYEVPIDYLWDDTWEQRERDKRDADNKRLEEERERKKEEEKKKAEQREYERYLLLKEKYEN